MAQAPLPLNSHLHFLYDIYSSDRFIKHIFCKKIFIHFIVFKKNIWELDMSVESSYTEI